MAAHLPQSKVNGKQLACTPKAGEFGAEYLICNYAGNGVAILMTELVFLEHLFYLFCLLLLTCLVHPVDPTCLMCPLYLSGVFAGSAGP